MPQRILKFIKPRKNELTMTRNADLFRAARSGPIEVSLGDLLPPFDAAVAVLRGGVPKWLNEELACERLQVYLARNGAWILAALDE